MFDCHTVYRHSSGVRRFDFLKGGVLQLDACRDARPDLKKYTTDLCDKQAIKKKKKKSIFGSKGGGGGRGGV